MRHFRILVALVLFTGCGDDPVSPIDRTGIYQATTVKGQALPVSITYILPGGQDTVTQITGGELVLFANMTQRLELDVRGRSAGDPVTWDGKVSIQYGNGTYFLSENRLVFEDEPGPPLIGIFSDARTVSLPLSEPYGTVVFVRTDP